MFRCPFVIFFSQDLPCSRRKHYNPSSNLIGHVDPSKHRILAAGDLNMIYGANAGSLPLVDRERTV